MSKLDKVQDRDKFMLRLPEGMRDQLKATAAQANRSMNAEILLRIGSATERRGLRDHFAGQAVQASISGHFSHYGHNDYWPPAEIASYAYEVADAMIAEREKGDAS